MAFVATSANHESPQDLTPALSQKQLNTGIWGTGGNTCLITDAKFHPNSFVLAYATGTVPPNGFWAYSVSQGTCTITSSNPENSTLAMAYIII